MYWHQRRSLGDPRMSIRALRRRGDFGARLIALARAVYVTTMNAPDQRRRINLLLGFCYRRREILITPPETNR